MRSFQLLILFLWMSTAAMVQAAVVPSNMPSNETSRSNFFTVVLPYDEASDQHKKDASHVFEAKLQKAMTILLVRITGKQDFLNTHVGKAYLKNPKAWLKTYDFTPRMAEGVSVGKNIAFTFFGDKLQKEFRNRFVPIWPLTERPKTLVMGTIVQEGTRVKLDEHKMQYRLDVEFRHTPQKIRLPIALPKFEHSPFVTRWILPADDLASQAIQEMLAHTEQTYLLSFKADLNGHQKNHITWTLFHKTGARVLTGNMRGGRFLDLTEAMFNQVMAHYVTISQENKRAFKALDRPPIILNIHNITQTEQLLVFERLLKNPNSMITSFSLVSLQAGRVQYRMSSQADYQKVLNWIKTWTAYTFMDQSAENQQIDIIKP